LKGQIPSLEASLANTQIELQAAQEKLANPTAQIVAIASHTAAEITGAQGQPPIPAAPAGSPEGGAAAGSSKDLMAQINAIQDPTARTMFYRKNKAAFMAASRADRK
ncbi:MAG: hypothetical protein NT154_19175, partial [Verrucomicrobia bacterium]|nr:hypothetical protein [Verrucomicrobiota bacterium]